MDQFAAQHVGNLTPLPSLELSVEPVTTGVDTNVGYTRLYGSHISWSTPTTPVTREINPQLAFDRLFRSNAGQDKGARRGDRSVLDLVLDDAKRLQSQVGKADRLKLDEYFDAVRAVEKRIAFDAAPPRRRVPTATRWRARRSRSSAAGSRTTTHDPARLRERGIDHTEQVRLMLDIMVLAFWTDSTRVAHLHVRQRGERQELLVPAGRQRRPPRDLAPRERPGEAGAVPADQHLARRSSTPTCWSGCAPSRRARARCWTTPWCCSRGGMQDGNAHSPYNLPIVLAGRARRHARHRAPPGLREEDAALQSLPLDADRMETPVRSLRRQHRRAAGPGRSGVQRGGSLIGGG